MAAGRSSTAGSSSSKVSTGGGAMRTAAPVWGAAALGAALYLV